jgi:hypothetical protein
MKIAGGQEAPAVACSIAWTAQQRLHKRYHRLIERGKLPQKAVVQSGVT